MTDNRKSHLVALAAGGTGGHVFPAEALAEELLERGCSLALLTDKRGAAFKLRNGEIDVHTIPASRISGGIMAKLEGLTDILRGIFEATRLLRKIRPALVVGFGGYASVPTMLAATRMKLPTLIHEQNAVLGRANRLLASRATAIATAFHDVERLGKGERSKVVRTGNPIRPQIAAIRQDLYRAPTIGGPFNLFIMGGSQGAGIFSRILPDALALLPADLRARLQVVQQCRAEDLGYVEEAYESMGINADLKTFFTDVPEKLKEAHLVIMRAGAGSVAEVTAIGRPALLVPYLHAMDDHQSANARAIEAAEAAWVMAEPDFTGEALSRFLADIMASPDRLIACSGAARNLGIADGASRLATAALDLIPSNGEGRPPASGNNEAREAAA